MTTRSFDHGHLSEGAATDGADLAAELDTLLADAAVTPLDHPAWDVLRRRARDVTRTLAARGLTPAATVVGAGDPPVVVARSLAKVASYTSSVPRDAALARPGPVAAERGGAARPVPLERAARVACETGGGGRGAWASCGTVGS